jgi:cytochrome c6
VSLGAVAEPLPLAPCGSRKTSPWWSTAAQLLLALALLLLVFWPQPAWGIASEASQLFDLHCAGCHPHGGNIIRRGRTLQEAALRRQGIEGPAAVARIAAAGIGRMDGYAAVLGEGGAERVGEWVWQQAQAGWPRRPLPAGEESGGEA